MKKFLHLKRSIVDSKNQTTIVQAYLDTIRSSCYKLATPHASPRTSANPSYVFQSNKPLAYLESGQKLDVFPFLSIKQSEEKPSINQKQQNFDEQRFEVTPQKQGRDNQTTTNELKLDQIFEDIKSQCKSSRQQQISQPQIMQIILINLQVLGRKKQYEESVQLIRNIIMSMGKQQSKFTNIANHSQMKKLGYIMQEGGEEEQPENSFDCSYYKSAHISRAYCEKATMLKWDHQFMTEQPKVNENHTSTLSFSNSMHSVSRNHEGNSIYIEDFPEQELTPEKQSPIHQQPHYNDSSNSMKSDETNRFNQQSLSCIHEEQDEDVKSSDMSSMSVIPEETIEFKKIIYMLDSNDTNKKSIQQANIQRSKSRSKKTSNQNSRNLFTEKSDESLFSKEEFNRTYTQTYSDSSPGSEKHAQTYTELVKLNTKPKALKQKTKQIKNTTVKIGVNKKKKDVEQLEKIEKLGKTNPRRTKQLQDIVNMLSNKYNRTIKLGK